MQVSGHLRPVVHVAGWPRVGTLREGIEAIIAKGEGKVVEFKATGRLNIHTGDKDPKVEWGVIKTIAGFMNAHGGTLLVGVTDEGEFSGIEGDFPFLKKSDVDGWELWLTDAVAGALGEGSRCRARRQGRSVRRTSCCEDRRWPIP